MADLAGPAIAEGTCARTNLPDGSADVVISCWSAFRDDLPGELVEAERILRAGGRLLVLHDYGRDDGYNRLDHRRQRLDHRGKQRGDHGVDDL